MDARESVRAQFGAAAQRYAGSWPHHGGPDLERLLAGAGSVDGARVLDVGCGAGHTAFALTEAGAHVVALDLTEAMLEQTRAGAEERGLDGIEVRRGDAEDLPFADGHFDLVTSRLAAHHFPHPERFATEAHRVLTANGCLLLSDSVSPEDAAQDTYLNAIEVLRDPSHVRNHRVSEWQGFFAAAGFGDSRVLGSFPCPLDFEVWTNRMQTPQPAREGLRALFAAAPSEVRRAFRLDAGGASWQLDIAVLRADR